MRYGIILIIAALLRLYDLPCANDIVPKFAAVGYTYGDMWYYFWTCALIALFSGFLWWECKDKSGQRYGFLVFIFTLSVCKITDENSQPFINFPFSEQIGWVIASLTTYMQWRAQKKQLSQKK